jgi:exodeoxyribonuclease V alpha subunit
LYFYTSYNDNKIKTQFPNKDVVVDIANNKIIFGIDYICFGTKKGDKFLSDMVKPLYHMSFSVKRIISQNLDNNYCYLLVNVLEYQFGREIPHVKNVVVEGYFYNVYPEAEFEGVGYWKEVSGKHETFVLTEHTEVLTSSTRATYNFIKHVLKGKRVSDKVVKAIIAKYDTGAIEALKNADGELLSIIKNPSRITMIQDLFISNIEQEEAFKYLLENNISSYTAIKVLEKYGKTTLVKIRNNPYCLLRFENIPLSIIDKIAENEGLPYNDANRIEACIFLYIQNNVDKHGDIYIELKDLVYGDDDKPSPLNKYVLRVGKYTEELTNKEVETILNVLAITNKVVIEEDVTNPKKKYVYKSYYNMAENYIVDKLKDINTSIANHYIPTSDIKAYLSSLKGITLDVLQKDAVVMALQKRLSIVTGGPGTGKTQTIKIIVDTLLRNNPTADIQLCAPTGKASRRMSEVIGMSAETIHKKLNYMPFTASEDEELVEIDCDLLIIDETSMIDIDLFYKLLKNISDTTSVLLVGDYNQIPSVGPGLILRDIIDSNSVPCVQLKKVFRQGKNSGIIDTSLLILDGNAEDILKCPDRRQFKFIEKVSDEDIMEEILLSVKRAMKTLPDPTMSLQVLTPMNDGLLGTLGLNKELQKIYNPPSSTKEEVYVSPTKIFREGDKLIQTVNNYDLKVFNGSIGILYSINLKKNEAVIDFDGEEVTYKFDQLNELNLAYAITVHKSQGSEFEYVIMPITSNHLIVNNKNLIYTALTRAKKGIKFIGNASALTTAIKKTEILSKKSQVKEKLKK